MAQPMAYQLKVRQRGDWVCAYLRARIGREAYITVVARISIRAIERMLTRTYQGTVGFSFKSIFKAAKKMARSVASSRVLKKARKYLRHPAVLAVSQFIPGANVALPALAAIDSTLMAAKAITAKRRGDPRAALALQRAQQLARMPTRRGQMTQRALSAATQIAMPDIQRLLMQLQPARARA